MGSLQVSKVTQTDGSRSLRFCTSYQEGETEVALTFASRDAVVRCLIRGVQIREGQEDHGPRVAGAGQRGLRREDKDVIITSESLRALAFTCRSSTELLLLLLPALPTTVALVLAEEDEDMMLWFRGERKSRKMMGFETLTWPDSRPG